MAWAMEQDPGRLGLRVPEAFWRFWEIRGHYAEGRSWLERALATSLDAPAPLRALALEGLGNIRWRQGDLGAAALALEESVAIRRSLGDKWTLSAALSNLGTVVELQGDFERAQVYKRRR